jgi:hypothetical protein
MVTDPRRRGGRPALDPGAGRSVALTFRLSAKQYDTVWAQARTAGVSMAEVVRQHLTDKRAYKTRPPGT